MSQRLRLFDVACHLIAIGCLSVVVWLWPGHAAAQYKNSSFGIDGGLWLITKPSILDESGQNVLPLQNRPLRLANGIRIGGESNFKLDADRWWFTGRFNLGFMRYAASDSANPAERAFDEAAAREIGTIMGLQGLLGIRYFFLTDRFRPYMQAGLSYMHLLSFNNISDNCQLPGMCDFGGSFGDNFLPHRNILGLHIQPGVEIIVARDTAIHIFFDLQNWVVFNAKHNQAVVIGVGVNLYSG